MVPVIPEILTIQGSDEAQKGPESSKGLSNPEVSKGVEVTAASENEGISTAQGDDEEKKYPEVNEESPNFDITEEI
mgnify:FL=1